MKKDTSRRETRTRDLQRRLASSRDSIFNDIILRKFHIGYHKITEMLVGSDL